MSIVAAFCPLSGQLVLDQNSAIMRDAQVFTYQAETTTTRTVFQDVACTVPHPNPIPVNAYGRIPAIYVDIGDYKVVIRSGDGSLIGSYEHLPGGQTSASGTGISSSGFVTGDVKYAVLPVPQSGWVVANGGTIGNGNSSGTARANDDAQALFVALWNAMPQLAVSPSRGTSATLDFQASKTLALPDFRGRVAAGMDKMGAQALAGVLTNNSTPTPDQIGTLLGVETTVLSVAQLPTFTPGGSIGPAGNHTHSGTTDAQGLHNHTGATSASGDHSHQYFRSNDSNNSTSGSGGVCNRGTYSDQTGAAGNHAHTFVTDVNGNHAHNLSINGVGDHTHALYLNSIGSGAAHGNTQPTILVYVLIRL